LDREVDPEFELDPDQEPDPFVKRCGSAYPNLEPHQNVTDPQHCLQGMITATTVFTLNTQKCS
jgi:hypothetical protein